MGILRKIFILIIILNPFNFVQAEILKIADFDDGHKPNLIKGDFGAWDKDGNDPTQFCIESFDRSHPYGGKGCSLQLDYDIDSPNKPAYNGFWMRLEKIDLRPWKYLYFYVRGDARVGYPDRFKVEIKNTQGKVASFLVEGITTEWKRIAIPLETMNKEADFSQTYEFTIVFDEKFTSPKKGRIYIDEFYLYK